MLAFRVTRPFSVMEAPIKMFSDKCSKLIIYEHTDSARPHIHGLMVDSQIGTDTMKNYIKKFLGKVEKTDWSFVTKDVNEKFIVYMSKGKLAPSYVKGFTDEQIEAHKNAWVTRPDIRKQMKLTYVVKETPAERKMRQEDMINEIIKRVQDSDDKSDQFIIGTIYRVVAVENKNMLSRYKVRDYYDSVFARIDNYTWLKRMVKMCEFKD